MLNVLTFLIISITLCVIHLCRPAELEPLVRRHAAIYSSLAFNNLHLKYCSFILQDLRPVLAQNLLVA